MILLTTPIDHRIDFMAYSIINAIAHCIDLQHISKTILNNREICGNLNS